MDKKLYTTIKTDQGIVKIPQDDIELQKVVSLIYSMDIEIDQLKAKLDKAIKALEKYAYVDNWMGLEEDEYGDFWMNEFFIEDDSDYEKLTGTNIYCSGMTARKTLKEIRGENE